MSDSKARWINTTEEFDYSYRYRFKESVAVAHGLHAAIVLHTIVGDALQLTDYFQCEKGRVEDPANWLHETPSTSEHELPYLTQEEIDRAVEQLVKTGLLVPYPKEGGQLHDCYSVAPTAMQSYRRSPEKVGRPDSDLF